jgi:uncharacterized protein YaeQ
MRYQIWVNTHEDLMLLSKILVVSGYCVKRIERKSEKPAAWLHDKERGVEYWIDTPNRNGEAHHG